jgi:DNA gyrase subunit A
MEQLNLITEVDILDESKECFLTYASEVLTDRAIPTAEDGLLSSQRKILWTMEDYLKMDSKGKTKKCNGIVGSTLATSYYHGDSSCYGVLCKMSQKYLMRYPLIEGQGSLGTQEDNDLVASSRYTEAKPSIYTDLMMLDYKKNPVPTKETYNGEYMEPVVLPGFFPNALYNGRQAIGISMSHGSLPHNLTEVCEAIQSYIDNPNVTIDDIMQYIKGPDFPLGGTIINQKDIKVALATGKSNTSLKIRGDYEIDGNKIIFTTIPYRTYRNKIKEQLENNVEQFETCLEDFNDESNLGVNKLVFIAKSGQVQVLLNKLFKYTDLQSSVSYNMNFIVNGTPKLCSIIDLIKSYVEHQNNIMIRIANTDLAKAQAKAHTIEGILLAIKDIDKAIFMIKNSDSKEEARKQLMDYFKITEAQANAILDMKLAKLTRLDRDELLKELEELQKAMAHYNQIINDEVYRNQTLKEKIINLKNKYGDARRTIITQINDSSKEEKEIEFVEPEKCVVIMTKGGLIKRVPSASFRAQKRNGKGVKNQDDITQAVIRTNTIDSLMVFTDKGRLYRLLVNDIPVGTNLTKGQPINSLIAMEGDETPAVIYSIYRDTNAQFVLFVTKNGLVKKTTLNEYLKTKKKTGMAAIALKEGDELAAVSLIKDEQLILVTASGMCIRFNSNEISPTSRTTSGVKGITLADGDFVVAALPVRNANDQIALFSHRGLGKRFEMTDLPVQKRAGKGLMCYKGNDTTGAVVAATLVSDEDNILIIGDKTSICIEATEIPSLERASMGNQLIKNSKIVSVSKV